MGQVAVKKLSDASEKERQRNVNEVALMRKVKQRSVDAREDYIENRFLLSVPMSECGHISRCISGPGIERSLGMSKCRSTTVQPCDLKNSRNVTDRYGIHRRRVVVQSDHEVISDGATNRVHCQRG